IPDDEDKDDIYIHHSDLASAMNNDKVLVRPERNEGRGNNPEGTVVRILERAVHEVVGTFEDNGSFGFVIADDTRIPNDIFIPKGMKKVAVSAHKVIARFTKYPKRGMSADAEISKVLGDKYDAGIDSLKFLYNHRS